MNRTGLRLLIVDDEELTREGLLNFIEWGNIGITEVRTAENGAAAMENAASFPPDILLTDIMMPHMNGIELSKRFREACPYCKIVLLSGNADKDMLKSAINLKVDAYLDKPIVVEQVRDTIHEVAKRFLSEKDDRQQQEKLVQSFDEAAHFVRTQIARFLITPGADLELFRKRFVPAYYTIRKDDQLQAALLKSRNEVRSSTSLTMLIEQFLEQDAGIAPHHYYATMLGDDAVFILFKNCGQTNNVLELTGGIRDVIGEQLHLQTMAVVGHPLQVLSRIAESYSEVNAWLEYCMLYEPERTLCEVRPLYAHRMKSFPGNGGLEKESISELFEILEKERFTNVQEVREGLYELYVIFAEHNRLESRCRWNEFQKLSLEECKAEFMRTLRFENIISDFSSCSDTIKNAVYYINSHIAEPGLSVGEIAQNAGFSTNYFSTLFKEGCGLTVNEYISAVRLQQTAYYLKNTRWKLYEICAKVGITDTNYLNTLFKKKYGISPSQYRKES